MGGDTSDGSVVGRAFTENVKEAEENVFYQEIVKSKNRCTEAWFPSMGTTHWSPPRPTMSLANRGLARFFQVDAETFAIASAHPDYDREWFRELSSEDLPALGNEKSSSP